MLSDPIQNNDSESVTAVDYLQEQRDLEREARELMPYDPNECTYVKGELRQPLFACLTCSKQNDNDIGICYSCSIQCHSTHELVELFTKRNFTCDCGTTRMSQIPNSACKLRLQSAANEDISTNGTARASSIRPRIGSSNHSRSGSFGNNSSRNLNLPAEDIPSLSNSYNQNYKGLFCDCKKMYNPLEETATMHQCYFGEICGEDWFHEDCILGYKPGFIVSHKLTKKEGTPVARSSKQGVNILDKLALPGEDAITESKEYKLKLESDKAGDDTQKSSSYSHEANEDEYNGEEEDDEDDDSKIIGDALSKTNEFSQFICWSCISKFKDVFDELSKNKEIVFKKIPHFDNVESKEDWEKQYKEYNDDLKSETKSVINADDVEEPKSKKIKLENKDTQKIPYSVLLTNNFRDEVTVLLNNSETSSLIEKFFDSREYLYKDDPVHESPREDDDQNSTNDSLLELGTDALLSLPREQAIEGLHAYDKIRFKLREFFKPFAEQGKIVTEDEVRGFFSKVKEEETSK